VWEQYDAHGGKTLARLLQRVKCRRENKILNQERVENMSIEKKSLISTLKSTKKANLANEISHDQSTRTAVKAQPVLKSAQKITLAAKSAIKTSLVSKASRKSSAAIKLVKK
jgi:hypothetical protein